jgi:hypothetical protein
MPLSSSPDAGTTVPANWNGMITLGLAGSIAAWLAAGHARLPAAPVVQIGRYRRTAFERSYSSG